MHRLSGSTHSCLPTSIVSPLKAIKDVTLFMMGGLSLGCTSSCRKASHGLKDTGRTCPLQILLTFCKSPEMQGMAVFPWRGLDKECLAVVVPLMVNQFRHNLPKAYNTAIKEIPRRLLWQFNYRIVSNKRFPSNKRPLTYFQIKLGKMPKFLYGMSL